jgi:hypothetical protein
VVVVEVLLNLIRGHVVRVGAVSSVAVVWAFSRRNSAFKEISRTRRAFLYRIGSFA